MQAPVFFIIVISILCSTFTVVSIARMIAGRKRGRYLPDRALSQIDERLTRMEQAIDSMAVEMERVSEGQRFTTKLLSQRSTQSVG